MENLKRSFIVWLYIDKLTSFKRIKNNLNRPKLIEDVNLKEEIKEKLNVRNPLYKKYSDLKIEVAKFSKNEVIEKIIEDYYIEKSI